jgi:hypothetical protein
MFSSRKDSVRRHVRNLHGYGHILRYIDYLSGRQAGFYAPSSFPTFERKESKDVEQLSPAQYAFRDGFWNEMGRDAYRQGKKQKT